MAKIDAGALPVGENDKLVGMITDRDIAIRAVAEGKSPTTNVRDIMSEEVLYCFDDQDLDEVAQNMSEMKIRRLPVVNRDKRWWGSFRSATSRATRTRARRARRFSHISEPGGEHSQSSH
jgi:CBS domain-containing protein